MKYPIGFTFVKGYLTYEVVEHIEKSERPYLIQYGFSHDLDDSDHMEMTEHEMDLAVEQAI
jgi:hypothetical protein